MSELEKKVLDAIVSRQLTPRPYAYFLARRSVLWTLSLLSVLLGAISFAILLFAVPDYLATGGKAFEELPLDDVWEHLPFVWLVTFPLLIASATFSFRNTPRGYRWSAVRVAVIALALSIVLGTALHVLGVGSAAHKALSVAFPAYEQLTRPRSADGYPDPDKGGLAGSVTAFDGKQLLTVRDFAGRTWTVDVAGAKVTLDEPLGADEDVEITGERTAPLSFRAYTIRDWD